MNNSSFSRFPWFSGLLGRVACCSLPETSETIHNSIIPGDTFAEYDDNDDMSSSSSAYQDEGDHSILDSAAIQPLSHPRTMNTSRDNGTTTRSTKLCPTIPATSALPSPTGAPSRRELDRWNPTTCFAAASSCCPSYAGSTATTASIMSEEEGYFHPDVSREEIRSNATTLVVSHRKNNTNNRRNDLLTSTLASAELRLRAQLQAEEERAKELRAQRQQQNAKY